MDLDIKDVLYNEYKEEEETVDNKKKVKKYKKEKNMLSAYIFAMILDFFIFGVIFLIILALQDMVLIEIAGDINRVLIMNKITIIVIENIFLFSYFYFYAKDTNGSTIGMKILGIRVLSSKEQVTFTTTSFSNIVFWIFFIVIDVNLLNSIDNVIINMWGIFMLILQIFILLILNGFRFSQIKIKSRDKEEKNEK